MSNDKISGSDQLPATRDREIATAPLPVGQQTALELLLTGKSIAETARTAGVSRTTIYQWMRNDPVFQAAYNEWHDQLREGSRSRLLLLTEKATDAVEKALEAGDAKMGLQLLKGMGMLRDLPPGPTDPAEVKRMGELQKRRHKSEMERAERLVKAEEMIDRMEI
ncbi:MAG: helix-turn-helix domain-containing protein [Tepidisphaeraceae bacterium]